MKRIWIVILVILVLVFGSACGDESRQTSIESVPVETPYTVVPTSPPLEQVEPDYSKVVFFMDGPGPEGVGQSVATEEEITQLLDKLREYENASGIRMSIIYTDDTYDSRGYDFDEIDAEDVRYVACVKDVSRILVYTRVKFVEN